MEALLIPVHGPVQTVQLDGSLGQLQELVGGLIEAIPMTPAIPERDAHRSTIYVNEEGKFTCEPNMRATDFMVPGYGIFAGDYVAGPMLVCGFNPADGEHAELPQSVVDRVRLIEDEAG